MPMTGAEVVAIISVSAGALTTLLSTCFHSRCTKINTPCINCERQVIEEENKEPTNNAEPVSPRIINR
jgi:cytidine deaminase